MTPNPILTVLFTLKKHRVKCLLIGGQACIIYGAAEFSRDSDFVILNSSENLDCLHKALHDLRAGPIYVPPLEIRYLDLGHACHFRCNREDVKGLRIDVISKLRGCDSFDKLWKRKNTISFKNATAIDVIGLFDLVQSKKTQRDKDWLMLKHLVNNDITMHKHKASSRHIEWWLKECRDASILVELAQKYAKLAKKCILNRPLLKLALTSDMEKLNSKLNAEEELERQKDKEYWAPLRKELEILRREK